MPLTGTHLWADRFDGLIEDVFELQDKVAVSVAGVIEPALQAAEMRRSAARPTTDLGVYDLYLRALAVLFPITKEGVFEALGVLEQAIAIDRRYGPALSLAANCHLRLVYDGWAEDLRHPAARPLILLGRRSRRRERPGRPRHRRYCAGVFGEDIGAMIGLVDRALVLNPSFARGWNVSGILRNYRRSLRSRDRAFQDLAAPEPTRAYRYAPIGDGRGLFL